MRVKSSNGVPPQVSIAAFLAPIPDRTAQDALLLLLLAAASGQQDEGEGEDSDALKPTTMEYVADGNDTGPQTGGSDGGDGNNGGHIPPGIDDGGDADASPPRKGLPMGAKIAIGGVSALGVITVVGASWIYMRVRNRVHNYSSMQQVAQQPTLHHPKNPIHQHVTKALSQNKPVNLSTAPAVADQPPNAKINGAASGKSPSTDSSGSDKSLSAPPLALNTGPATSHGTQNGPKAASSPSSLSAPALALSKHSKASKPGSAAAKTTTINGGTHDLATHVADHAHVSEPAASPAKPTSLTTQPVMATTSAKTTHGASTPAPAIHMVTSIASVAAKAKSGSTATVATAATHPTATGAKPKDTSVASANAASGAEHNQSVSPKMASELQHLQHSLKHLQTQMVSLKKAQSAAHHAVAKAKKANEHHERASAKANAELAKLKKREAKLVAENKHLKGAVHWLSEVEARLKKKLHHKAAYPGWCVIGTGLNSAVLSGPEHKTKLVHVGTKIFGAKVTKIDPSHNVVMTTDGVFSCQN